MIGTTQRLSALPLRLMLGFGFAYHGFPKLFSEAGHEMFVGMLTGIGVPLAGITSYLVGGLEFFGGLALIAGAFVPLISALGAVNMLVAALTLHLPVGFNFMNMTGMGEQGPQFGLPGFEVPLLYLAGFAALFFSGAGPISVDALRRTSGAGQREAVAT